MQRDSHKTANQDQRSQSVKFDPLKHMTLHMTTSLPQHPNGMRFTAFNVDGDIVASSIYYSIGGGFIVNAEDNKDHGQNIYYKGQYLLRPSHAMA